MEYFSKNEDKIEMFEIEFFNISFFEEESLKEFFIYIVICCYM